VWEDLNANGVQDPGEGGLPDVTVELYSSGGAQLGSTATDGSGHYEFSGLAPGSYYLKVHAPAGFAFSPKGKGSDVGKDSDANSDGRTDRFTLVSGQKDVSRDFGLYERASFDPLVWEDVNGNGVQDQGESGLYNVTVELHGCDGLLAASTATDVKGYYIFSSVMPGSYYVEFVAPAGYLFCPKGQGGDATRDSDADVDGRTDCFNLLAGENDVVRDAGLYRRASVGDLVWEDVNEDGVQDEGEDGLCNVTVELHGGDGWLVASTTTDASGRYSFSELTPGNYYLRFVAPAGYRFSPKSQGGDGGMGSCAPSPTGETECFALASGEHGSVWDAGLYKEEKSPRRTIPALATWVGLVAATMVLTGSGLLVLRGGARFGNK